MAASRGERGVDAGLRLEGSLELGRRSGGIHPVLAGQEAGQVAGQEAGRVSRLASVLMGVGGVVLLSRRVQV